MAATHNETPCRRRAPHRRRAKSRDVIVEMSEDVDEKLRKASDAIRQGPHAREEMPRKFAPVKQGRAQTSLAPFSNVLNFNDKKICSEMVENGVPAAASGIALTDDSR